jgi:hypothetical protein
LYIKSSPPSTATLSINGAQVLGSGGAWTQILQAEIDKRATQLIRLLRSGWQPPVPMAVRPAPVPENYDLITDFDRGAAKWEKGWLDKQAKVEGYKAAAQRRRWHSDKGEQMGMFEQEGTRTFTVASYLSVSDSGGTLR